MCYTTKPQFPLRFFLHQKFKQKKQYLQPKNISLMLDKSQISHITKGSFNEKPKPTKNNRGPDA